LLLMNSLLDPVAVPLQRGALTISIDLELLWGVWDNPLSSRELHCGPTERAIATRLLELFERYQTAATWAIVGRLLDDSRGYDGLRGDRDAWFAPDIIDQIRRDGTEHEIGSHSWGHIYCHQSTAPAVREDLGRARDLHRQWGLPFDSFVFPRNQVAHLDELKHAGLRVFRSTDAGLLHWTESRVPSLRPAVNLMEKALALPTATVLPLQHANGLIELPSSTLLMGRGGSRRLISPARFAAKMRRALLRAAESRTIFHLWFHPSNFYDEPDVQFGILEHCLRHAATLRTEGRLDVRTMGDFAPQTVPT
jgi:hypothetical protein